MLEGKIFELAWRWFDSQISFLLYHPNKTKKEFRSDVEKLLKQHCNEYLEQEEYWASISNWLSFIVPKLITLGYEKLSPTEWSFWGCSIIEHYEDEPDESDLKWCKLVGKQCYEKVVRHNITIRKELDKWVKERLEEEK